jgi:hypothetical protein
MSHEHEQPADGAAATDDPAPRGKPLPDFLARAMRILRGDIRPEDYLQVTPEVQRATDFEMAHVRSHLKLEPPPEAIAHQLKGWLLSFHHGGQNIIYIENEKGVVVLAVGSDQVRALFRGVPHELQVGLNSDVPEPF